MYGKIFDTLWQGSMFGKPNRQLVFVYLISNADHLGIVDIYQPVIAAATGIPEADVRQALLELEGPDPSSRTPDSDGARIARLDEHRDWGWLIVNHEKYMHLQDLDASRRQARERKRAQRSRHVTPCHKMSQDVTLGHGSSRYTDTDTDTDTKTKTLPAPPRAARASRPSNPFGVPEDFPSTDDEGHYGQFDTIGKGQNTYTIQGREVRYLQTLYPSVSVTSEVSKMRAWLAANGKKTAGGMPRFIVGWLNRATDRGGAKGAPPGQGRKRADDAYREQNEGSKT